MYLQTGQMPGYLNYDAFKIEFDGNFENYLNKNPIELQSLETMRGMAYNAALNNCYCNKKDCEFTAPSNNANANETTKLLGVDWYWWLIGVESILAVYLIFFKK